MSDIKLKGYLYFAIEKVEGLPVFGENSDRVDSYVSVFIDDMEEGATDTVYDDENPVFNKQLRVKLNGYYETCAVQVLNAQPQYGWSDSLGQVVLDLAKITANGEQQSHTAALTLRPEAATGDATKDAVQGTLYFVTKYKAYKKKASKAEREAALAKARAEAEAKRQAQLEQERKELQARLEYERKQQEALEKKRLAEAQALKEKAAREEAERRAAEEAARAKAERERHEAEAKAALERKAVEEAARQEALRVAQEVQRQKNEARQRMLLEAQKKSQDASQRASAEAHIADMNDGDMLEVDNLEEDDILAPPRGKLTTQVLSKQSAPSVRLSGTVSNVSAGFNGDLYVANSSDRIYTLVKATKKWRQIPGRAICLAAAPDGTVWCANRFQRIYELGKDGRTWTQKPGSFQWLGVGSRDHIWAVDIEGRPHKYNSSSNSWTKQPGHNFQRIAVGDDGEVWAISKEQRAFRWEGKGWKKMPGMIKDIAVQNEHCIWATSIMGGLYSWRGNCWAKLEGGEAFHGCTISEHGAWAFDANGRLYYADAPISPKIACTVCMSMSGNAGPNYTLDKVLDNDPSTFYWSAMAQMPGLMLLFMFKEPLLRQKMKLVSGKPVGVGGDPGKISHARVEITFDGRSWVAIGMTTNGDFESDLPSLPIRGARVVFLRMGPPCVVRELSFTGMPSRPALTGCTVKQSIGTYGDYDIFRAIDNDIGSYYWSGPNLPKKGDFVQIDFSAPVEKRKVIVLSGLPDAGKHFITAGSLAVSYDGTSFVEKRTFANQLVYTLAAGKAIRAIRIEFEEDARDWVAIREIALV